jgi:hypothetical protein
VGSTRLDLNCKRRRGGEDASGAHFNTKDARTSPRGGPAGGLGHPALAATILVAVLLDGFVPIFTLVLLIGLLAVLGRSRDAKAVEFGAISWHAMLIYAAVNLAGSLAPVLNHAGTSSHQRKTRKYLMYISGLPAT